MYFINESTHQYGTETQGIEVEYKSLSRTIISNRVKQKKKRFSLRFDVCCIL